MTQLYLDYQSGMKPYPWAGVTLLTLAFVALTLAGFYYKDLTENIEYWEAKTGQVKIASARQMAVSQREMKDMDLEIKHANEVLSQITLPWDKLFEAVEWSSGKNVALLGMEPDVVKHEVKISGEAKNIAGMLSYIQHLQAQEIFNSVYLQNHQVQQQNPEKPVRFALVAAWKGLP